VDPRSDHPPRKPGRRPEVVVVLGAPADEATTMVWCDRVRTLLRAAPGAVVSCDIGRLSGSAAEVVEALARLRLVALAGGGQIRLRRADPALLALLDLLGFADLLPPDPPGPDG
jgi:hypothetical protein